MKPEPHPNPTSDYELGLFAATVCVWPLMVGVFVVEGTILGGFDEIVIFSAAWLAVGGVIAALDAIFVGYRVLGWAAQRSRLTIPGCLVGGVVATLPASALWLWMASVLNGPLTGPMVRFWPLSLLAPGLLAGWIFWRVVARPPPPPAFLAPQAETAQPQRKSKTRPHERS